MRRRLSSDSVCVVRALGAGAILWGLSACGPTIGSDDSGTGDGSGSGSADGTSASSADGTSGGGAACGENDSELVGGGPPGVLGYPDGCDPTSDPGVNGYRCCSDDPAAPGGALPDYLGKGISGGQAPYFSGANNDLSRSGQCIQTGLIAGLGLLEPEAADCPIPCNPTWADDQIGEVCGAGRVCCQTRELQPADCIMDLDTGLWRPVTGADITEGRTAWRPEDHATHQDPNGSGCLALFDGSPGDGFQDCVEQLTVADQRGFCMALPPGQVCPHAEGTYVDACEMMN